MLRVCKLDLQQALTSFFGTEPPCFSGCPEGQLAAKLLDTMRGATPVTELARASGQSPMGGFACGLAAVADVAQDVFILFRQGAGMCQVGPAAFVECSLRVAQLLQGAPELDVYGRQGPLQPALRHAAS